ncbi:hypothetical protein N658DRAFT_280962 [Parathielavia hyrcaniae]|uniref:Uncharacterized protein n=1 Tax=Parathielavia hyrcaniae TaxID=113614 RepID=A0AAN6T4C0_9PEZI|nr:hypothetical protein N658DRAFT_280962 [Parathielavia hyrcaniae]
MGSQANLFTDRGRWEEGRTGFLQLACGLGSLPQTQSVPIEASSLQKLVKTKGGGVGLSRARHNTLTKLDPSSASCLSYADFLCAFPAARDALMVIGLSWSLEILLHQAGGGLRNIGTGRSATIVWVAWAASEPLTSRSRRVRWIPYPVITLEKILHAYNNPTTFPKSRLFDVMHPTRFHSVPCPNLRRFVSSQQIGTTSWSG